MNPTQIAPFPREVADFRDDERISFDREENKYLLVDENHKEWEFDEDLKRWVEPLDQDTLDQFQANYTTGYEDASNEAPGPADKKRKKDDNGSDDDSKKKKKPTTSDNRAIYVTGIPLDATPDEIDETFSRYGGLIAESDSGGKRIKMYTDEDGAFKGDALIVFFRKESVDQAINLLDKSQFRYGENASGPMTVKVADSSYKRTTEPKSQRQLSKKDKENHVKRVQMMNQKLSEWDDDEPQTLPTPKLTKWDKTVVLKNMFTLQELAEDPNAYDEIKEDVQEEAEQCGEVNAVQLYDKEPQGILSVRFETLEAAQKYVQLVHGRWFDQRRVEASIAGTRLKYKKSSAKAPADSDEEEEEAKRLDRFGEWIESGGNANDNQAKS